MPVDNKLQIGVIGGGLMGMAIARKLTTDDCKVTVFERDQQLGGLATHYDYGKFTWDRFYHVILPSDRNLIGFIDELQLSENLKWRRTYTGFYVDKHMYSISNNIEFLRFPLLSLYSKARLSWTMWYCSRINDWKSLEKISVEDWLIRVSGPATYKKLWKPLLLAKLGDNYQRVSAVFIWSYIKRLFSARHSAASKEQLGHVAGGYKSIFERLRGIIEVGGGEVRTGSNVISIRPADGSGLLVSSETGEERFDRVICTSPVPVLKKLADSSLLDIANNRDSVEYLGVICVILVSTKPLVPFYVVNIADPNVPFTGVIGMSNVVSLEYTAGLHITYLPKYVLSDDTLFQRSDEHIKNSFLTGVRRMFPDFDFSRIDSIHVNRAERVQPLQVLDYSSRVPSIRTKHPDFFVLNTAQFVNATLNNNEVIGAVNEFFARYGSEVIRPTSNCTGAG